MISHFLMEPRADSQSDQAALWMLTTKASMGAKLLGQGRNIVGIVSFLHQSSPNLMQRK